MTSVVIDADSLGKRYQIGLSVGRYGRLTESLASAISGIFKRDGRGRMEDRYIWAIRGVSLEIAEGEVVGIIGRNGAGKTTLLRILSRITEPTEGRAVLKGRVGSLLEVGTGFHPELSGRENIYLNGAILGMRRREIEKRFDEIVSFAEVERFIDTPAKRYSSGMYVRLAFAVAAHLEPDILIVDEVLSVGDAAFQKKCLGKMDEVAHQGRTVLVVSHNMAMIQSLCSRAYLLERGQVTDQGDVGGVIEGYLRSVTEASSDTLEARIDRQGDGKLRFAAFESDLATGAPGSLTLIYRGTPPLRNVHVSMAIYTHRGEGVLYLSNDLTAEELNQIPANGSIVCKFDRVPLLPGTYTATIYCAVNGVLADWILDAVKFDVTEGDFYGTGKLPPDGYGSIAAEQSWEVAPH